jgi:hypothetical protein
MKRKNEQGQAILELTLMLPVIVGILALIVDLGLGQWRHMVCTTSAQAAANGAAVQALRAARRPSNWQAAGSIAPFASQANWQISAPCELAQVHEQRYTAEWNRWLIRTRIRRRCSGPTDDPCSPTEVYQPLLQGSCANADRMETRVRISIRIVVVIFLLLVELPLRRRRQPV